MSSTEQTETGESVRDSIGRFLPGQSGNRNGRPKGSKNKFTELKDVFLEALEEVGGKEYVKLVARTDPKTFLTLVAKMLPRHNDVKVSEQIEFAPLVIRTVKPDDALGHSGK